MRQLGTEEKAALLLTPIDNDDDDELDNSGKIAPNHFPTIAKRPKSYNRTHSTSPQSLIIFLLILSSFIFGCLSGVIIMIYRVSQDTEHLTTQQFIQFDSSIQTKLAQTIVDTKFVHSNISNESLNELALKLKQTWTNYTNVFHRVNQLTYDLTLTKYSMNQWSGIELIHTNQKKQITKFNLLSTDEYLTYSSLIKSGQIDGKYVCYVNYGRDEDFAYLFERKPIQYENHRETIVFMRRNATIISETEQIRQAIRYEFGGLVLFDNSDRNCQSTTNNRLSIVDQWSRLSTNPIRQNQFLNEFSLDTDQSILLVSLSNSDVENIFSAIPSNSNDWPTIPDQWHSKSTSLKLGGEMKQHQLRLNSSIEQIPIQLPVIIGHIQGQIEQDKFIVIGYQLGQQQQQTIVNQILRAFQIQISNGWKPRRSMLFCAWSDLSYDHFTMKRWLSDNVKFVESNLIAYIDLGNGVQSNATLNLRGSPLFEHVAWRTADFVVSPLVHDHVCHRRQTHIHRKRRHTDDHQQQQQQQHSSTDECQPHKLLDEWIRTSKIRFETNKSIPIVRMIDEYSSASIFQLKYGIPALTIEMTDQQAISNQTFYSQKLPSILSNEIHPEVLISYTQFVTEFLRQLIDEPLLPLNLTAYADLIDAQTTEYVSEFERSYRWVVSSIGDSNEIRQLMNDLTKSIRQNEHFIEQTSTDLIRIQQSNEKLRRFERLFIDNNAKHLLIGRAFGLTNTMVYYPMLSNLLYNLTSNPPTEIADAIKYHWIDFRKQIQLISRTLVGFDSLLAQY